MFVWPRRWVRPHPARVVEMRKRAFDPCAALAHQAAAASSPHPATIAIHRRPGLGILRPITSPPVRLGHVGPDTPGVQVDQGLIAVIPLITDDLFQRLPIVNVGLRVFDLLGRGDGGLDDRRGVADIGPWPCHRDNRAGLHVDGLLGFVRQMRAAIFHLRDRRIGIVGVRPVCVRGLLLPASDPVAPDPRAWASRPPRPSRDPPETLGRSRRCPGGRCCASPRSPRASWRQSRWSYPSAGRPRRVVVAPTERRSGASPDRSSAACAPSSNDRVAPRPRPPAESGGPPTSPSRATQSRVPSRCLRRSRPAAGGSSARVPSSVGPSRARRTGHTGLRRTDRRGARRAASSAARRTDGPARWAGPTSRSTAAVDPSRAFP